MGRTEDIAGFGVAIVGHIALVVALALALALRDAPPPAPPTIDVSFEEEVGPVSSAPEQAVPAAPTEGEESPIPEQASGADASIPEETQAPPETVRPPDEVTDRRRADATRSPVVTRPSPPRPQPQQPQRPVRSADARPAQPPRPNTRPAQPQRPGTGPAQTNRGSRLPGMNSFGTDPASPARQARPGATVTAQARASFVAALTRQIARCSSQQRPAALEARSLRPVVTFSLNRDGSLASQPRVIRRDGETADNRRYGALADEAIVRAIRSCAPYTGLPSELYDVPNGWRQPPPFRLTFQ